MVSRRYLALFITAVTLGGAGLWIYQNFIYYSGWFGKPSGIHELVEHWAGQKNIPGLILRIDKDNKTIFNEAVGAFTLGGGGEA